MYGKFIYMIWCDCCCKFAVSLQIFHTPAIRKQLIGAIIGVQNLCALKKTLSTIIKINLTFHFMSSKKGKVHVPALSTSRPASSRLVERCKSPSQQEGANSAAEARKPQAKAFYHGIFMPQNGRGLLVIFPQTTGKLSEQLGKTG